MNIFEQESDMSRAMSQGHLTGHFYLLGLGYVGEAAGHEI
jgi:hypothetical protein